MVGGRWLAQSAERTANVARRLAIQYRAEAVEFYDNNFFVHEARTADFAERILDLKIGWWGESRIDTLLRYSDRSWELMRDSGLRMVFMGAESGSDETLLRMNNGGSASTAKTLASAATARRNRIRPDFSLVMGNPPDQHPGFPTPLAAPGTVWPGGGGLVAIPPALLPLSARAASAAAAAGLPAARDVRLLSAEYSEEYPEHYRRGRERQERVQQPVDQERGDAQSCTHQPV